MADFSELRAYLDGPFATVRGWCNPALWQALQPIAADMLARGTAGPVAEIGVHHGRFFIGLVKTMGGAGPHQAIDVFDMQEFNLDQSGKGNLEMFRANLAETGIAEDSVAIRRADSMTLGQTEIDAIRAETGGVSIFSVDGCHLVPHTVNDLHTAFALTRPDGLVLVDDYLNPNWPGVQEGVARLYLTETPRFVPLLYMANKLFLAHVSHRDRYLETVAAAVAEHFPETRVKRVPRFGHETLTLVPAPNTRDWLIREARSG